MLKPEGEAPPTLLHTLSPEDEALLQADMSDLPQHVCDQFAELLKALLATMASSLAYHARHHGSCESFEASVTAGHHHLITGAACGFAPEVLEAVLYRLHPDLRIAPVAHKVRAELDKPGFEESLRRASVVLRREGEQVWVLPRTDGFQPRRAPAPGWVRARPVKLFAAQDNSSEPKGQA